MVVEITKRTRGPRTYIVVKDPKSKKAVGMTIRGMTAEQVIKKLEEVFSSPVQAA